MERTPATAVFDPVILSRLSSAFLVVGSGRPGQRAVKTFHLEDEEGDIQESQVVGDHHSAEDPLEADAPKEEGQPEPAQPAEEPPQKSPTPEPVVREPSPQRPVVVEPRREETKPAATTRPQAGRGMKKQVIVHEDQESGASEGSDSEQSRPTPSQPLSKPTPAAREQLPPPSLPRPAAQPEPRAQSPEQPRLLPTQKGKTGRFSIEVRDEDESKSSGSGSEDESLSGAANPRSTKPQVSVPVMEVYKSSKAPAATSRKKGPGQYAVHLHQSDTESEPDLIQKHLIETPRTTNPHELLAEKRWKTKQQHMFCAVGFCAFVLAGSIVLWALLFHNLMVRNGELADIILYPPTLQTYHSEYIGFWEAYEKNEDILHDRAQIFGGNEQDLLRFRGQMTQFSNAKASIATQLEVIKAFLALKQGPSGGNARRLALEETAETAEEAEGHALARKLGRNPHPSAVEAAAYLTEDIGQLNEAAGAIRAERNRHLDSYGKVMEKVAQLYQEAYKVAFNYGRFYEQTLRIWVTSDNIFRLFLTRFEQLAHEVRDDHFRRVTLHLDNVRIIGTQDPIYSRVAGGVLQFENTKDAYLVCQISGRVEDPERKHLDTDFQFELVPADMEMPHRPEEIWNTVFESETHFVKPQVLRLAPNQREVQLYARASPGRLREINGVRVREEIGEPLVVQSVTVSCLEMSSYLKFPEYEK